MSRRRIQSIISTILLLASVALLAVVGLLYLRDRNDDADPARPTAVPGHYQLIDIVDAIKDEGVDARFGAKGSDVRSIMLERPGQVIELESGQAYVFIYPDIASQEAATLDVLPEDIDLKTLSGEAVDAGNGQLFTQSNVAVLVVNADADVAEHVKDAVALLP